MYYYMYYYSPEFLLLLSLPLKQTSGGGCLCLICLTSLKLPRHDIVAAVEAGTVADQSGVKLYFKMVVWGLIFKLFFEELLNINK